MTATPMPHGTPGTPATDGVDGALAAAETDLARAAESMVALERHRGFALLGAGGWSGVSAARRAETLATVAALHRDLGSYRGAVERARALRTARRPGPAVLAEVTEALSGPSILVAEQEVPLAERGLLGPTHHRERATPPDVLAAMTASFAAVAGVVEAVAAVWDAVAARWAPLERALAAPDHTAPDHTAPDPAETAGPDARRAGERLDALRRRVLTDPLAHHGELVDGGPGDVLDELAAVGAQVDGWRRRAAGVTALRAALPARVAALTAALDALAAAEDAGRRTAAEVARAVHAPGAPLPGGRAAVLRRALGAARAEAAAGRGDAALDAFALLDADLADAVSETASDRRVLDGLLERRAELRGRLGALRAKATVRGRAEDLALDALHHDAEVLLRTAPCDLAAATVAVRRYQRALETPAPGSAP